MNFRKLLTYFAFGTAAVMPFAGAQNPTILQGNYITNVFGNSNFVLNPNAQTNTSNVTFTSTQVTRSTTTPLVATSEFNLSLLQNANADWSTRTFDAGMKGQNCEARFTYRGFATATTTAQIVQNSLVVAQLVLTPSTDPRIASINFPCGDLSFGTTFRIAQTTAAMTGTNEIGGIYVGLATNQANVAQAEIYGGLDYTSGTNGWSIIQSTYTADFTANGTNGTGFGNCSAPATAVPQVVCNNMPSGNYQIVWPIYLESQSANTLGFCRIMENTSGSLIQEISTGSYNTGTQAYTGRSVTIIGNINFSAAGSRTFKLQCKTDNATQINATRFGGQNSKVTIYRFPSSSELVVKPETQNVFAAASWTGGIFFTRTNTTEFTISDAVFSTNRTAFGKAQFTGTANDVAITIPQMPPGTYKIELVGESLRVQQTAAGSLDASCKYYLKDGTNTATGSSVLYGPQYTIDSGATAVQIVKYTSIADRTFTASAQSVTTNSTACGVYQPKIIITPLDQPSNSALYVQGPVLGAQTGAAISAGYQGEQILTTAGSNVTPGTSIADCNKTVVSQTLQPGNYLVFGTLVVLPGSITGLNFVYACISTTPNATDSAAFNNVSGIETSSLVPSKYIVVGPRYLRVTSPTTIYLTGGIQYTTLGSAAYASNSSLQIVRLN